MDELTITFEKGLSFSVKDDKEEKPHIVVVYGLSDGGVQIQFVAPSEKTDFDSNGQPKPRAYADIDKRGFLNTIIRLSEESFMVLLQLLTEYLSTLEDRRTPVTAPVTIVYETSDETSPAQADPPAEPGLSPGAIATIHQANEEAAERLGRTPAEPPDEEDDPNMRRFYQDKPAK